MKQILVAIMALMLFTTTSFAQDAQQSTKAKTEHVKKDGTPDKRFKENKSATKTKHLKKDGTADKRFKENKTSAKKAA
ncbi:MULTISPECIES: hypothetical protein [Chitinophagaceae]